MSFFGRVTQPRGGFFGRGGSGPRDRSQEELNRLLQIADAAGTEEPRDPLAPLENALDIIARPLYTVAGFTDSLLNEGGSVGDAFQRAGTEFFSGIGGLKGQKETFGRVLDDAGVGPGFYMSDIAPNLYNETGKGWRFKKHGGGDITGRSIAGFALDVAADPLTYLTFGSGRATTHLLRSPAVRKELAEQIGDAATRQLIEKGKLPFTTAGIKKLAKEGSRELPEGQRKAITEFLETLAKDDKEVVAKMIRDGEIQLPARQLDMIEMGQYLEDIAPKVERLGKWDPDEALMRAVDVNLRANDIASDAALYRMVAQGELIGSLDTGGVKFMGQTIPGLGRGRFLPITNRTSEFLKAAERTPLGAQVASGIRSLDSIFNQSRKAARNVPGWRQARSNFRADMQNRNGTLEKSIEELVPKAWSKQTVQAGERAMPLDEYVIRHISDPKRYPAEALPAETIDSVQQIRTMWQEFNQREHLRGSLDLKRMRAQPAPAVFDNTREQLDQLAAAYDGSVGRRLAEGTPVTDWNELRLGLSIDEIEEFAKRAASEGAINFELKPVFNLRQLMHRRGVAHNRLMALHTFETEALRNYGLAAPVVGREVFRHIMPEIDALMEREIRQVVEETGEELVRRPLSPQQGQLFKKPQFKETVPAPGRPPTAKVKVPTTKTKKQTVEVTTEKGQKIRVPVEHEVPAVKTETRVQQRLIEDINDDSRVKVGELLANSIGRVGKAGQKVDLSGLNDKEQALYWMGRLRHTKNIEEFFSVFDEGRDLISKAAPGLDNEIMRRVGLDATATLNSFSEPMQIVARGPWKGHAMAASLVEDVARMGEELWKDPAMNAMLKAYDWGTNIFKLGVTGAWPAFVNRNGYNNVIQNFVDIGLAAFDPIRHGQAVRLLAGADGTLHTIGDNQYAFAEIRALARRFGIVSKRTGVLELTGEGFRFDSMISKVASGVRVPNDLVEKEARMLSFVEHLRRGLDPVEAAARVNRVLFDYGELSATERSVLRRMFPFYTWMNKNVRLQAQQLMSEPGRLFATQKPAIAALSERGPERDVLPEYLRGDYQIKLSEPGKGNVRLTGIDLPFGAAIEQVWGSKTRNALLTNLNAINPFMAATIEKALGRDLYTGRELTARQSVRAMGPVIKTLPKETQDWLEFQAYTDESTGEERYDISGTKAHLLFKGFFLSRFFSTAESFTKILADEGFASALLDVTTGMEFREFDMTETQRRHLQERRRRLEGELKRKGKVREFKRVYLPANSELRAKIPQKRRGRRQKQGGFFGR